MAFHATQVGEHLGPLAGHAPAGFLERAAEIGRVRARAIRFANQSLHVYVNSRLSKQVRQPEPVERAAQERSAFPRNRWPPCMDADNRGSEVGPPGQTISARPAQFRDNLAWIDVEC